MSVRCARTAVAAGLVALAAAEGLAAQDSIQAPQLDPALEEPLPGDQMPRGVREISPEALRRLMGEEGEALEMATPGVQPALRDSVLVSRLRDSVLVSRVGDRAVRERTVRGLEQDRQSFVLPYRVLSRAEDGPAHSGPGARGRPSYLRPVIQVGGKGLSFADSLEGYRGRIYVGVQDSLDPDASAELSEPIHFLLDVSGGSAEPRDLIVEHTNLPFREVTVTTREIRDSVRLRVRSSVHSEPLPLTLPVSRPALSVTASPPSVPGLGLETTTLTVTADRLPAGGVPVTVESTMGRPEPSKLELSPDAPAQVTLRSTGLGATEVRVRSPGYRAASTRVRFGFPVAFLAAALLGGVAGGTARRFRKGGEGEETKPWIREAGVAVLFGLIVAVAYAIGINLLGVEIGAGYGEALVFTLAALGGYFRIPTGNRAPTAG